MLAHHFGFDDDADTHRRGWRYSTAADLSRL
jgi:hypothetical protein